MHLLRARPRILPEQTTLRPALAAVGSDLLVMGTFSRFIGGQNYSGILRVTSTGAHIPDFGSDTHNGSYQVQTYFLTPAMDAAPALFWRLNLSP